MSWLDIVSATVGVVTALGSIAAIVIAVVAIRGSHRSVAANELFAAAAAIIAALQRIEREGTSLALNKSKLGSLLSRAVIDPAFSEFLAARARADLAMSALGINGPYPQAVLNIVHNAAAGVRQADEFEQYWRDQADEDLVDQSWLLELSWAPSDSDVEVLARSASFQDIRSALSLVPDEPGALANLDWWWGQRVLDTDLNSGRSVYSVEAHYLIQTSRLVGDLAREFVQPMFEEALKQVPRRALRRPKPVFVVAR